MCLKKSKSFLKSAQRIYIYIHAPHYSSTFRENPRFSVILYFLGAWLTRYTISAKEEEEEERRRRRRRREARTGVSKGAWVEKREKKTERIEIEKQKEKKKKEKRTISRGPERCLERPLPPPRGIFPFLMSLLY
jgi:hypothetical protein